MRTHQQIQCLLYVEYVLFYDEMKYSSLEGIKFQFFFTFFLFLISKELKSTSYYFLNQQILFKPIWA